MPVQSTTLLLILNHVSGWPMSISSGGILRGRGLILESRCEKTFIFSHIEKEMCTTMMLVRAHGSKSSFVADTGVIKGFADIIQNVNFLPKNVTNLNFA